MKTLKRFLTLLLAVVGAFTLSACKPEEEEIVPVTEYNALGSWVDGGDSVYTLNTNTEDELSFAYAKGENTWAYMMKDVSGADLSTFKKLVLTVEGVGTMLVKLEAADGTAREISLNVTGITGSYEWNLINDGDFLATVEKIVIFGAPGKTESTGSVTISELTFYTDVAANYIIQSGFDNIPQNVNEYDGVSDTFDFNSKWENFSEETYIFSYETDGTHVTFDKAAGLEWSTMKVSVQGDFSEMNYIVFKVSGTAGQKFLAKPNNYNQYENFMFLTADVQELVLDITDMPAAEKAAITEIFVFGAAGVASVSGEFVIEEAFFAKEYEYDAPVFDENVYTTGTEFSITHWYDGGDLNYTITADGTDLIFDYTKTGAWTYAKALISGDLSDFDYVDIVVTGQENKTAMFKIEGTEGAKEEAFTFTGVQETLTIDLTTMSATQLAAVNKMLIFAAQGSDLGSGSFTIHSITFKKAGLNVNDLWADGGDGVYTITTGETTTVDYAKVSNGWAFIKADFTGLEVSEYNTLTMVVDGTEGSSILIKPNDNGALEQTITFGTEPIEVVFSATEFVNIILFAEGGTAPATGSFEIVSAFLSYVNSDAPDLTNVVDFTTGSFVDNEPGTYAISVVGDTTVVDYTKGAGQEWSFMKIEFDAEEVAGLNTLTLTLSGTEGRQLLVKPNNSGALETWVTFGTEPVTITINADSFTNVLFFAEGGTASVSGQFVIESATVSYTVSTTAWIDGGDGVYTITVIDGVTTVDYVKGSNGWAFLRVNFDGALVEGLNTLTITVAGTEGLQVLVKPNDNSAIEEWVTFGTEPVTLTFTETGFTTIILFGEPNVGDVTGSFQIIETVLSYTAEE